MRRDLFAYDVLDGMLVGSENPMLVPRWRDVVRDFVTRRGIYGVLSFVERPPPPLAAVVHGLIHHHQPIADVPTAQQASRAVELIERHLAQAHVVWVHCQRGIDRTGSIIGCCLAARGRPPETVLKMLFERFPPARRRPRARELWRPYEELIRSAATWRQRPG